VPVINFELFENEYDFTNFQLSELFKNQVKELKKKLCDIFELETL